MEKDYKVYTIRRLFKEHIPLIEKCCRDYDCLHFNPLTADYIGKTLLTGSFWGVFYGEQTIALSYMQPADSPPFSQLNAAWEIADLLNSTLADSMLCGYLWAAPDCEKQRLYSAITRLWVMQAARYDKSRIIHYIPAHTDCCMRQLFENDFLLAGLRGLDNIVPHYIFTRETRLKNKANEKFNDEKSCPASDTMTVSMLCEHGYKGYGISRQNILFRR